MLQSLAIASVAIVLLSACSETAPTTTQLTEVPEPHPVTCGLAADLAVLIEEVETKIEARGGEWRIASDQEDIPIAEAFIATARQINIDAGVVAATDPWAEYAEQAAATVSGDLQEVADDRTRRLEVVLVPTSYNTLIGRCVSIAQTSADS